MKENGPLTSTGSMRSALLRALILAAVLASAFAAARWTHIGGGTAEKMLVFDDLHCLAAERQAADDGFELSKKRLNHFGFRVPFFST